MTGLEVLFEARTPCGFLVRVSPARWELITTVKHPVMTGREASVKATLESPDDVRQSRTDREVLLFSKAEAARRWVCAVTRQADADPFLVTHPTDAIKEGVRIWPKYPKPTGFRSPLKRRPRDRLPNNTHQQPALRAAADRERWPQQRSAYL